MRRYLNILLMATAMVFVACDKDDDKTESINLSSNGASVGSIFVQETDTSTFENPSIRVDYIVSDDQKSMTMTLNKVKFSSKMPVELDIIIPGVSIAEKNGYVTISGNEIVPEAMGGPFPKYTITNLEGKFEEGKFSFSMLCGGMKVWFEGDILLLN